MNFFGKILGLEDPAKTAWPVIEKINALEKEVERLSAEEFKEQTRKWQEEIKTLYAENVESYLERILPNAFAAVREASRRTLGQRHYDEQLIGGIMLHRGKISEMKTGEGKTLAATLPVYLNALTGRGVHVVTVNDYLARRDASWMGQIYNYLGLSVTSIQHEQSFIYQETKSEGSKTLEEAKNELQIDVKNLAPTNRKQAYNADILYGTNNEFGFDYLRDNMAPALEHMAQRELNYAIVDEVDSILIDEARTPLIISAPDVESTELYREFANYAKSIEPDDFVMEEKHKQVTYSDKGFEKLEKKYGQQIYSDIKLRHHADSALRAHTLFKKDRDYVVKDDQVIIVDEFTGRLMIGRRYSEGLHQAIEAKEGVVVQQESKTLATITFQNYFRLYKKLAGMTGTAITEAEEFNKIYKLDVVEIPTHRPMVRQDLPDSVYKNENGKFTAIVREIKRRHELGQPMLIGTISIERNEHLSTLLTRAGVKHEILNAKNHEREAHIIAQAGKFGQVTLATNIAGRGVDILLGGNPSGPEEAKKVRELGGLHIMGTERHESRRIDNQLRGRAGRQGDPGSSQFFLSLEDDLMRLFAGDRVKSIMDRLGIPEDQSIEHGMVSKTIESAQRKIEGLNFDLRKHVLDFDDVLNKQRSIIYGRRRKILNREINLKEQILENISEEVGELLATEEKPEIVLQTINAIFPIPAVQAKEFLEKNKENPDLPMWINDLTSIYQSLYQEKEKKFGENVMRKVEQVITLQSIDNFWMEHLDTMDHLRQSVRLRGYAQKDPLIEYKQDGLKLFERMLAEIDKTVVYTIFKVEIKPTEEPKFANSPEKSGGDKKIGRNDPCWCGSGKKFKRCHGK